MTNTASNQDYFTTSDIGEIVDHLISGSMIAGSISTNKKVAATMALNAVRILRDRLGDGSAVLKLIYTDEAIASRPLARFMGDYLSGKYSQEEAEQILDGLQADMRQNYFQRKIAFGDPSTLPSSIVLDLTGDFTKKLKEIVEGTVAEYDPKADSKTTAEEIYRKACDNPVGNLDFDAFAGGLAEIIARSEYSSLVLSVGVRDPTPPEFAGRYLNALDIAYRRLGHPNPQRNIDRKAVLEERTDDAVYQRELKIYKDKFSGLLII